MSRGPTLCHSLLARLRESFGEPDGTPGRGDHWSLKPSLYTAAINVLVDSKGERPIVWIFDSHEPDGFVWKTVHSEDEIGGIVGNIEMRLRRARGGQVDARASTPAPTAQRIEAAARVSAKAN